MPEKKNMIPLLAIAFVVAIICTGVFYGLFVGKLRSSASAASPAVVVAVKPLVRGAVIQPTDVREAAWSTSIPKGAFHKSSEVNGLIIVEPIQEGEPITQMRVAGAGAGAGSALGIPHGMRAVSVRVAESPGVTGLLRPGHRVDVQYVGSRPNSANNEPELRTILQDIEVLAINPQQETATRVGVVVVTLLVKPAEADVVGLADASSRVRLVLRNPKDHDSPALGNVSAGALLRTSSATATPATLVPVNMVLRPAAATVREREEAVPPRVVLSVQMVGAGAQAVNALGGVIPNPSSETMQVMPVSTAVDLTAFAHRWASDRQWDVLSSSRLVAVPNREVSVQASAPAGDAEVNGLRVQLRPSFVAGQLRLRVRPEVLTASGGTSRRVASEVELVAGQSVLVTGFPAVPGAPLLDHLFPLPGGGTRRQQLLIVVTPKVVRPLPQGE